jgi:ubiquitin-like 1-activating enzyme E1 B
MVGAGGIGCELLKNIVLTGFGTVTIVDLDTIDLSNLNRQFLFRHEHIKKSKALVAKEAAHAFNPNVKIEAHHANIKEPQFNIEWYHGFDLVFNALDNLDARRYVNKMCLAANVPLIESGTTGFNGQVQVIKKGVTACYDCTAKQTPKTFPVCTIRSTPSQAIHCIVWAKSYLLNEIFGESEDETAFDHSEDADNANEIAELKKEAEELRKIRESVGTEDFPKLLFEKVFNRDVARLRAMEDMWKFKRAPEPLDYATLKEKASTVDQATLDDDQTVWPLEANLAVLERSLDRLSKRLVAMKREQKPDSPKPIISFDKDDEDTLSFVAAAANIRSHIFGIDGKSEFDIKQMAGNIIPAIATTNAIVAGLCVLEAFKVLKDEYDAAKEVFLSPFDPQRLLASNRPLQPTPGCPVCSTFYTEAQIDFERATLEDLVDGFVRKQLGYGDKEISVSIDAGIIYDPDETDNLPKKLSDLSMYKPEILHSIVLTAHTRYQA